MDLNYRHTNTGRQVQRHWHFHPSVLSTHQQQNYKTEQIQKKTNTLNEINEQRCIHVFIIWKPYFQVFKSCLCGTSWADLNWLMLSLIIRHNQKIWKPNKNSCITMSRWWPMCHKNTSAPVLLRSHTHTLYYPQALSSVHPHKIYSPIFGQLMNGQNKEGPTIKTNACVLLVSL